MCVSFSNFFFSLYIYMQHSLLHARAHAGIRFSRESTRNSWELEYIAESAPGKPVLSLCIARTTKEREKDDGTHVICVSLLCERARYIYICRVWEPGGNGGSFFSRSLVTYILLDDCVSCPQRDISCNIILQSLLLHCG